MKVAVLGGSRKPQRLGYPEGIATLEACTLVLLRTGQFDIAGITETSP